ncbi:unnamed protein product [Dovyalis caffra]|uniref:Uncharacterized protein n=1 Tax=Dovyalis caffra TaxID=77055 RepID=A0AAV1QQX3_9ROSI|nr:unnamed protein product [Dovyalis caffra]
MAAPFLAKNHHNHPTNTHSPPPQPSSTKAIVQLSHSSPIFSRLSLLHYCNFSLTSTPPHIPHITPIQKLPHT